jgi:hypothetical protein
MLPQGYPGFMQGPNNHLFKLHETIPTGTPALMTLSTDGVEHAGEPCQLTLEAS